MSRTRKHPLTGAKRVSHQCRNHGECEWCRGNRTYNELRDKEKAEYDEKEFKNNDNMADVNLEPLLDILLDETMGWLKANGYDNVDKVCFKVDGLKEGMKHGLNAPCIDNYISVYDVDGNKLGEYL